MESVLSLRRDPPLHLYVWGLWAKVPALMWLMVIAFEVGVAWRAAAV